MGEMKFEMPNDYGIYLHDTPHKELFDDDDRWLSNGCVRLEDYRRFAAWVFGDMPQATSPRRTAGRPAAAGAGLHDLPDGRAERQNGVVFRPDPYGFDELAMPQMRVRRRARPNLLRGRLRRPPRTAASSLRCAPCCAQDRPHLGHVDLRAAARRGWPPPPRRRPPRGRSASTAGSRA